MRTQNSHSLVSFLERNAQLLSVERDHRVNRSRGLFLGIRFLAKNGMFVTVIWHVEAISGSQPIDAAFRKKAYLEWANVLR